MNHATKQHLQVRALCEGAIFLALAVVFNALSKVIFASMPNGGSISLAMFPILFYVHRWGIAKGLLMGFAYGLLDMLTEGGYAWGWQSILLDFLVAYGALGLGGLFKGKDWGIFPDIAIGGLARFAVHHLSGITLYRIVEPTTVEGLEKLGAFTSPHLYSLAYNGAYMVPNILIAMVLAGALYLPLRRFFSGSDLKK